MNEKDLDELLAGRALHALSAEDERRLDAALAEDPELRARASHAEETAALLADAAPEVAPPPSIRSALLARIAQADPVEDEETVGSDPEPRHEDDGLDAVPAAPPARRARRRWFALAASVVVVAGIGVGAVVMTQMLDRPEGVVALDRIEEADDVRGAAEELPDGGSLVLRWSHEVGEVVVLAGEMPELDDGSQYELWFVRDETPVSAGVFDGGDAEPTLLEGELAEGDVVAVTVEEAGGSPTGEPTTDPLAAIPTD